MFELHTSDGRYCLTKSNEPGLWMLTLQEIAELAALGNNHFEISADAFLPQPRLYVFSAKLDEDLWEQIIVMASDRTEALKLALQAAIDGGVVLESSEPAMPIEGVWLGYDPR